MIVPFTETQIYKKDLIGIKQLNEEGKLFFEVVKGRHQDPTVVDNPDFKKIIYHCF